MDLGKLVSAVSHGETSENGAVARLFEMVNCQEGLFRLITQLERAGLDRKVRSWVGQDSNQPITGAQLSYALGPGKIKQLSQQTSMSEDQVADDLAQNLPRVIDQLTPDGWVPGQADMELLAKWVGIE